MTERPSLSSRISDTRIRHPWLVLAILLLGGAVVIGRVWSSTTPSRAQAPADPPSSGRIYTVVGNGAFSVDDFGELPSKVGKRATEVEAPFGEDLAIASNGDLLVVDEARVWRVGPDGIMRVAAGVGRSANSREPDHGDGGPAARSFVEPTAIAALPDGGFLLAEQYEETVRRVWPDGTITSVAGRGFDVPGGRGDGGPATKARVEPLALAVTADGGYLVLERARVRRIAPDGTITTVAGTGVAGFSGDGGPAVRARIHAATADCDPCADIAVTPDGGFLIADTLNNRIRKIGADGRITTVAGDGRPMPHTDGGPAVRSSINMPIAVAPAPDGGFRFAEDARGTIRHVDAEGTITTVIGGGDPPNAAGVPVGDGGSARDALVSPSGRGLLSTPGGGWLFTDFARVRLVTPAMPQRLDAAVVSVSGRARSPVVRLSSTTAGVARVVLSTAKGRIVASVTQPVPGGDASIQLSPVKSGSYWLDLTVTGSDDRFTSTRLAVVLGSTLPASAALHALKYRLSDEIFYMNVRIGDCHRVSRRRIDCAEQGPRRCRGIHAVTLRDAFTFVRRYGCRAGVRRTPKWLESAQPWPALGKPPL